MGKKQGVVQMGGVRVAQGPGGVVLSPGGVVLSPGGVVLGPGCVVVQEPSPPPGRLSDWVLSCFEVADHHEAEKIFNVNKLNIII